MKKLKYLKKFENFQLNEHHLSTKEDRIDFILDNSDKYDKEELEELKAGEVEKIYLKVEDGLKKKRNRHVTDPISKERERKFAKRMKRDIEDSRYHLDGPIDKMMVEHHLTTKEDRIDFILKKSDKYDKDELEDMKAGEIEKIYLEVEDKKYSGRRKYNFKKDSLEQLKRKLYDPKYSEYKDKIKNEIDSRPRKMGRK